MPDYIIVTATERLDPEKAMKALERKVSSYICKGYKPVGGVSVERDSSGNYYYTASQAIYKE